MEDVEDIYALSPMQHGMLFDSVTVEDSGMYLIQLEYFLRGPLDAARFEASWQATLANHAVLRTSFHWDDLEKPLQVVHRSATVPFAQEDLSELTPAEQDERRAEHRDDERARGVAFDEAPLMRLTLFRAGPDEHVLLWGFHHILMEGWSASMVLEEVLARYRAGSSPPSELPKRRPYRDYIAWLLERDPAEAEAYWKAALADYRRPTHLAVDRSSTVMHAPVRDYDGRKIELSAASTAALSAFARAHELTLNTVVQGAWALLCARYSGDETVGFGTIVSGRSVPLDGVDTMVGLFVNLLPAIVRVPPNERVAPWLRALQERQVRQRAFESTSLAAIKAWSEVPAGLPLFESILVFENWHGDLAATDWGAGLSVSDVHGHHGGPGYPIAAVVIPAPELVFGISYDAERFDGATIDRMLEHVRNLLESLPARPDAALADVSLLGGAERAALVAASVNPTELPSEPVHRAFAAQAARTPDAPAVEHADTVVTYRELDERANRLAHHLRSIGAGEHGLVGLCVERDPSMLVGLLGILKAGCGYVPLDPAYPAERLRWIQDDARLALVVTQERCRDRLPPSGARLVSLDGDAAELGAHAADDPDVPIHPESVAYMIYTSGSTGRPKGVMVPHRALANYAQHAAEEFAVSADDRMLQFASISFDTAAEEIYPTFVRGATLVLRTDEMLGSAADFLIATDRLRITIVDFPTAYWHVIVDGLADAGVPFPPSVRFVILGGERAKPEQLATWFGAVGNHPELLNTYGPTEATIVGTGCLVTPDDEPDALGSREVPIGKAIRGAAAYVLDPRGEPCPIGVPGELCLGGAGVARGYWERPALTAERFVPDPFSAVRGARLYRTGDVARYRPDGRLEFLGRSDDQVKFRGYRIELGEIEAVLAQHAGVRECVVVLRTEDSGTERLVGYVVPAESGAAPAPHELRRSLEERLPAYMVPSAFAFLDALPLTTHNKVDRAALPKPEPVAATRGSRHAEPRTELEVQLAAIWEEVLEVDGVGLHDNFFDLGGHSLLLMRVVAKLKKDLGLRLAPGELVLPTLGQLATLCEERLKNPAPERSGLVGKLISAVRGRRRS